MNKGRLWCAGVVLVLGVFCAIPLAAQGTGGYPARPGEVIIKFKHGVAAHDRDAILADLGTTQDTPLPRGAGEHVRMTKFTVDQAIARYRSHPKVQFIEPNYIYRTVTAPNDPGFPRLWGLENTGQTGGLPGADIDAPLAWSVFTGSDVMVAITDTGIDWTHPDLAANVFVNPGEVPGNGIDDDGNGYIDDVRGWDFVHNDNDPMDDHYHGTHVSGTVGAIGNNGIGVAGVNWHVRLLALKFLDAGGSGTTADAVSAVTYAVRMGAKVISASWGGGGPSEALRLAIASADSAGVLFVAAAGNAGQDNDLFPNYPSNYDLPNIIAVAATDHFDRLASWSNHGATTVDLAAPGVDIYSTMPGGYGTLSGTSMATPHVTGALALILGRFPGISGADAKALLLGGVDVLPSLAGQVATGGRLNAWTPIREPDTTPPGTIADLRAAEPNGTRATLRWTATGDDGAVGTASRYEVRYSTAPIDDGNFGSAERAARPPRPAAAGGAEEMRVTGLAFLTRYYFAVKAFDEFGNPSPLSNGATATTLGPPDIAVTPGALHADLLTGQTTTQVLTVTNTGQAELNLEVAIEALGAQATRARPRTVRSFAIPAARAAAPDADAQAYPASTTPYADGRNATRAPFRPDGFRPTNIQSGSLRVLLLHSGDVSEIRGLLATYPDIAQVDEYDARGGTPTLAQLLTYDTVIVGASWPFSDPAGLGNVLADYVDSGGGVVLTLASFINGWALGGRFLTGGYSPFPLGSGPVGSSSLGSFDASHPIMAGVTAATGDLLGDVTLASGSELVASWASGEPMVATRGPRVAAVNIFVSATGYWTGDIPLVLHNAAFWAAGAGSWLSAAPDTAVVPAGGQVGIVVTFDATGLDGGDYDNQLAISSDDPDEATVAVPARLHVTGAPDLVLEGEPVTVESAVDYQTDGARTVHRLPVTVPAAPGGAGSVELIAEGDYGDPPETATAIAEGQTLGSAGHVGSDCAAATGSFPVGATPLATLMADGVVEIEVQNSAEVNVFCPTNRHTVRLKYGRPGDRLDFGSLFVGARAELGLIVRNVGSAPLEMTSITSDRAEFTPGAATLTLAPRTSQGLTVAFRPGGAGTFEGTLRLASNDPDQPALAVRLTGTALLPPDIAATPATLAASLLTGEISRQTLTIANTGASDLTWQITLRGVSPGPTAATGPAPGPAPADGRGWREPRPQDYQDVGASQAPPGYVVSAIKASSTPGATALLIEDVMPWGTTANEAVLNANRIAFDEIPSRLLASTDLARYRLVIVASDQPTSCYDNLVARAAQLEGFVTDGGVLEFHAAPGWAGGDPTRVSLPGGVHSQPYYSFTNRVLDPAHALMQGVPNPFRGNYASHAHFSGIPAGASEIAADESNTTDLIVYRFGSGMVVTGGQTFEYGYMAGEDPGLILRNLIPYAHALAPAWLSVSETAGHIPAGGHADIGVVFDATGQFGGDYRLDVVIASNDPDESEVTVPASLHVTGAPDVALSRSAIDYGTLFVGLALAETLVVSNAGTDRLTVGGISASRAEYTTDAAGGFSLAPRESRAVVVTFRPVAAGPAPGTLTVHSDDPDEAAVSVALTGTGLPPPDIALAPAAILADLMVGGHSVRPLRIANDGESPLTVQLATRPVAPAGATAVAAAKVEAGAPPTPISDAERSLDLERYRACAASAVPGRAVRPADPASRTASVASALPPDAFVLFQDDMEGGTGGWSHHATHANGIDHWGRSSARASSGSWSWNVSQHDFEGSEALQSPPIDLTGLLEATLTFQHWYRFDDCGSPTFDPDGGIVELSTDGGANWQQIAPSGGYPYTLDDICYNPLAYRDAFAHASGPGAFIASSFDLTPFVGGAILLRFHAGWDCGNCALNEGWYVDDVVVYSHGPRWVSLSTNAVTVAPHAATTVNLAFDATGLAVGAHDAELVVRSNDPDEPVLVVPIDLQVADVAATIDVDPNTLSLDRRANWVTAYLELPAPGDLGGVVVSTLRLNRASSADPTQHSIGDEDHDGVADMTLKFDQDALAPTLEEGDQVAVVMTGELPGNHRLLGTSTIRVIRHHVTAPNGGEVVAPGGTLAVRWSVPSGWHPDHADVLVSLNGGTSWSRIAAGLTGTTFSWVVPNVATQAALVRVTLFDALGEIGHDSSDQPFTITANPTAIQGPGEGGPHRLLQNSPNPFRSATETSIGFVLPGPGSVRLAVYDAKGHLTGVIADGWMPAGAHQVIWDGRDRLGRPVSAGVYFYQLRAGEVRLTHRMVVLR